MTADCTDIKDLRKTLGMTQEEVAELAGISLRSYKSYENEEQKKGTPIYRLILELLQKRSFGDEEHGIISLDFIKEKECPARDDLFVTVKGQLQDKVIDPACFV